MDIHKDEQPIQESAATSKNETGISRPISAAVSAKGSTFTQARPGSATPRGGASTPLSARAGSKPWSSGQRRASFQHAQSQAAGSQAVPGTESYRQYSSRVPDSQWSVRQDWNERTYYITPEIPSTGRQRKETGPKQHLIFRPLCTKPKPAWTERFHLDASKDNDIRTVRQRKYFDHLPTASWDHPKQPQQSGGRAKTKPLDEPKTPRSESKPSSNVRNVRRSVTVPSYDPSGPVLTVNSDAIIADDGAADQPREQEALSPTSPENAQTPAASSINLVPPAGRGSPTSPENAQTPATSSRNLQLAPPAGRNSLTGSRKSRQQVLEQKVLKLYQLSEELPKIKPYADFYMWCIKVFQNLTRCWRRLDTSQNMSLSQLEFLTSLRDYNFKGDAKMIFQALDRDRSGSLSYYHFDPTGAKSLIKLVCWADEAFGSLDALFIALDANRNKKLSAEEFKRGMQEFGFESSEPLAYLFHMLDVDKDGSLTIRELDFLKCWKFEPWLRVPPDFEAAQEFKHRLMKKYRENAVIAWNLGLDLNNEMRVSWEEFQVAGAKQEIEVMKLARIWCAFDRNQGGWLSLKEFDAEAYRSLVAFKEFCDAKHGSIRRAMMNGDANEDKVIQRKEFRNITKDMGLPDGGGTWLFNALDCGGHGVIALEKVRYLDAWNVERDRQDEEFWHVISTCFESNRPAQQSSPMQRHTIGQPCREEKPLEGNHTWPLFAKSATSP